MESHFVDVSGIKTHFLKAGEGEPLLILHGWGSSAQVMSQLAQHMAIKNTCYVIDFPGFGKTPAPNSAWDVSEYMRFTQSFIQQVIGRKTSLLVHSFGGRVALKLLEQSWAQTWIDKVLITGGAGMKPRRTWRFYYRKYLAKTLKAPFLILPKALQEKGLQKLRQTDLWKSLGSSDYKQLEGVMREIFVKTVSEYLEKTLPNISHEVFLLWGKNDDSTPMYQAERIKAGIQNATLVGIDGAGHYAFLDNPSAFYAIADAYFHPKS
ncbi:alpha/beta hydrolase [bacterium]|nr:MAG: alpha/beta hydrolase [bacterium]